MNNEKLIKKVDAVVCDQCYKRGYAAPVDVLLQIGVLSKEKYKEWQFGHVDYLERVCNANLSKLSLILHEIRVYARKKQLKPSVSDYKQWGKKNKKIPLRFSKYGNPEIEKQYSTHYVDKKRIEQLKEKKQKEADVSDIQDKDE